MMPTGYTHGVQDGTVTEFKDFALQCARAFGALVLMRDEPADAPIPDEFKPSDYHSKNIARTEQRIEAVRKMTDAECEAESEKEHLASIAYAEKWKRDRAEQKARYESMLTKVHAWTPPSSEHDGMKRFMREQLTESIKFDCSDYSPSICMKVPATQWRADEIAKASKSLAYHTEEQAKEVKRAADRTAWIRLLRESLEAK